MKRSKTKLNSALLISMTAAGLLVILEIVEARYAAAAGHKAHGMPGLTFCLGFFGAFLLMRTAKFLGTCFLYRKPGYYDSSPKEPEAPRS